MTPDEIRVRFAMDGNYWNDDKAVVIAVRALGEIAAQLCEFNGNFRMIHGIELPQDKE